METGIQRQKSARCHFFGPEGVKLYNTFVFRAAIPADADRGIAAMPAEDKHNLDTVMYKFGEHYGRGFDFIECFTTTFLRAHSWLNWVDEDDDEHDEVGLKERNEMMVF